MTLPKAKIPFTSKSVKKLVNGPDLISLIVPVEEGLRKFDQIHGDTTASPCGAFLMLSVDTGSGLSSNARRMAGSAEWLIFSFSSIR